MTRKQRRQQAPTTTTTQHRLAFLSVVALCLSLFTSGGIETAEAAFVPPPPPVATGAAATSCATAVVPNQQLPRAGFRTISALSSSLDGQDPNGGGGAGDLIRRGEYDRASLLASAFAALDEDEQYDAVLTGLCAKILDGDRVAVQKRTEGGAADGEGGKTDGEAAAVARDAIMTTTEKAFATLADPIRLLTEMNERKVKASGRSLMALIDAAAKSEDSRAMSTVLSLSISNGSLSKYGSLQASITQLPSAPTSKVLCPDGRTRTRAERLQSLPRVPVDDRSAEVASALAFSTVVSLCLLVNSLGSLFGLDGVTPYSNFLLTILVTVVVVDNFYDVIKLAGSAVATAVGDKAPDAIKNASLPDKGSMPLGLGTGETTGTVVRGLTRLLSVDTERECQCEAAAFFAAYSLGLPCFAFRPNALEAAVLVVESTRQPNEGDESAMTLDPLLSDVGILKMLIWLMAPVAMESSKHPQLIASDPREGRGLLKRLKEKSSVMGTSCDELDTLLGDDDGTEEDDLLRWAYAEADLLLRSNKKSCDELAESLAGGAATVGDCVAVLEEW